MMRIKRFVAVAAREASRRAPSSCEPGMSAAAGRTCIVDGFGDGRLFPHDGGTAAGTGGPPVVLEVGESARPGARRRSSDATRDLSCRSSVPEVLVMQTASSSLSRHRIPDVAVPGDPADRDRPYQLPVPEILKKQITPLSGSGHRFPNVAMSARALLAAHLPAHQQPVVRLGQGIPSPAAPVEREFLPERNAKDPGGYDHAILPDGHVSEWVHIFFLELCSMRGYMFNLDLLDVKSFLNRLSALLGRGFMSFDIIFREHVRVFSRTRHPISTCTVIFTCGQCAAQGMTSEEDESR